MTQALKKTMNEAMSKVLKRLHYPIEVMLVCVRWYAAYPPSLRNLEEMMGCGNRSASTTSSGKTTERSSASCDPCSGSRTCAAHALIASIESMHMTKKGQLDGLKDRLSSAAIQFYSLAF